MATLLDGTPNPLWESQYGPIGPIYSHLGAEFLEYHHFDHRVYPTKSAWYGDPGIVKPPNPPPPQKTDILRIEEIMRDMNTQSNINLDDLKIPKIDNKIEEIDFVSNANRDIERKRKIHEEYFNDRIKRIFKSGFY